MAEIEFEAPELEVADPIPVIEKSKAVEMIKVPEKSVTNVNPKVSGFLNDLVTVEPGSPEFTNKLENVFKIGENEIQKTAVISSRLLERPAVEKASTSPQMKVAGSLGELRQQIVSLDPDRADLKGVKKIFKWIPGGNKVDQYFQKYATAKQQLDDITAALLAGQDALRRDNSDIEVYRKSMWENMGKLAEYNLILEELDKAIVAKAEEAEISGNQELKKGLENEALFAVRQRRTDVQTQMAVAAQGYLALGLIRKNNIELIRGVDRAQSTSLAAIQTAIVVAQALGVQEQVLAQITGLNAATGDILEKTSLKLKDQGAAIQQQASSSMIEVDKLKAAFDNVFAAMDSIDNFRSQANENFAQTITLLEQQVERAKPRLRNPELGG